MAFGLDDAINNSLFAAHMNAHLSADHGTSLTTGSLLARNTLMFGDATDKCRAEALNDLRRSGDARSVERAARRLWATGPLAPLADAASRIRPDSWTHSTARANLALWEHAGDLLEGPTADDAALYCLEVLRDDAGFTTRTTPSFLIPLHTLEALAGLLPAATSAVHAELATFVAGLPPIRDEANARATARAAANLRSSELTDPAVRAALRDAAAAQPHAALSTTILGVLAPIDERARTALVARVGEGDDIALGALGDVRLLTDDTARPLADRMSERLEDLREQAKAGSFPMLSANPARTLAQLAIWFPDVTDFDSLVRFLRDEHVAGEHKLGPCLVLAAGSDQLPEPTRAALRDLGDSLPDGLGDQVGHPMGAAPVILAAAMTASTVQPTGVIAQLLAGSARDREDAALLLACLRQPEHTGALIALVGDSRLTVRSTAAYALALRVAASDDSPADQLAVDGLKRALEDPGANVPIAIARGVLRAREPAAVVGELIAPLTAHISANVREIAGRAVRSTVTAT